jgi:hypothetical protein
MSMSRRYAPTSAPADCDCGCGGTGGVVDADELVDYLESHTTDEDLVAMELSLEAQADGDAASALDHYRSALHVPGLPSEAMLETLALLGPAAPPWAIGRWIMHQAWTRLLLDRDRRVDRALRVIMSTCYDVEGMTVDDVLRLGTLRVSSDRAAIDTALFHLHGLADYIDEHATPALLERAPDLQAWVDAPMRPYRFESRAGLMVTVRDLVDDRPRDVYDIGSLDGSVVDDHVLGRVAPDGGGGHVFVDRPVRIDAETAAVIAGDVSPEPFTLCEAWVLHVGEAIAAGRLPEGAGRCESHPLSDHWVVAGSPRVVHPGLVGLVRWTPVDRPSQRYHGVVSDINERSRHGGSHGAGHP